MSEQDFLDKFSAAMNKFRKKNEVKIRRSWYAVGTFIGTVITALSFPVVAVIIVSYELYWAYALLLIWGGFVVLANTLVYTWIGHTSMLSEEEKLDIQKLMKEGVQGAKTGLTTAISETKKAGGSITGEMATTNLAGTDNEFIDNLSDDVEVNRKVP